MIKTTINRKTACACLLVLALLLSSGSHAGGGGEASHEGYNVAESYSTIEEDGHFCGNGNQCMGSTAVTKRAGCDDPAICPNWFRRYIINPIRGALRTNFD